MDGNKQCGDNIGKSEIGVQTFKEVYEADVERRLHEFSGSERFHY